MSEQETLNNCPSNCNVRVEKIEAGYNAHQYLADMGIHEGETLRVIKNNVGPIIVKVKGTRVAIGRGLADKVIIVKVDEG